MKTQLDKVPIETRPQPDTFHERTGHELKPEKSRIFSIIKKIESYAIKNKMKINYKNTKLKETLYQNLSVRTKNWNL